MKKAMISLVLLALALALAPAGAAPLPVGANACSFAGGGMSTTPVNTCEFVAGTGPHFFFTELDSLRAYLDNNNNNAFNPSVDTDLLRSYDTNNNHRVDPGPFFDRTEQPAGTFEVAAGKTVRVEAWPNGGSYLGAYYIQ